MRLPLCGVAHETMWGEAWRVPAATSRELPSCGTKESRARGHAQSASAAAMAPLRPRRRRRGYARGAAAEAGRSPPPQQLLAAAAALRRCSSSRPPQQLSAAAAALRRRRSSRPLARDLREALCKCVAPVKTCRSCGLGLAVARRGSATWQGTGRNACEHRRRCRGSVTEGAGGGGSWRKRMIPKILSNSQTKRAD